MGGLCPGPFHPAPIEPQRMQADRACPGNVIHRMVTDMQRLGRLHAGAVQGGKDGGSGGTPPTDVTRSQYRPEELCTSEPPWRGIAVGEGRWLVGPSQELPRGLALGKEGESRARLAEHPEPGQ